MGYNITSGTGYVAPGTPEACQEQDRASDEQTKALGHGHRSQDGIGQEV